MEKFVVAFVMIAAKMEPNFWSHKMIWLLPVTRALLCLPNGDQEVFFAGDFEVLTSTLSVDWMADQSHNTPKLTTMEYKSHNLFILKYKKWHLKPFLMGLVC